MSGKFWRYDSKELENIADAIENGFHGKWNKILEEQFCARFGVQYSIGINSGTSALHAALFAVGVQAGDEVIVPPLTFGAPAFAALMLGAYPVFADVDPETFNVDPADIERKITDRTKAIVAVSLYGLPGDMDRILAMARKRGIKVIEDNAQCVLGEYPGGRLAGTLADMSIFSFQRSKHITSETGGIMVTNDERLAELARKYSILGYQTLRARSGVQIVTKEQVQSPDFERHELVGPNYRLAELCAAAMSAQMDKLDDLVEKRMRIAGIYAEAVGRCEWLVPQKTPAGYRNSYWTYTLRLDTAKSGVAWSDFRRKYLENGGEPFYAAWMINYLEPAFRNGRIGVDHTRYRKGLCPIAESIQPQLIQLKTNFQDLGHAERQGEVLYRTATQF